MSPKKDGTELDISPFSPGQGFKWRWLAMGMSDRGKENASLNCRARPSSVGISKKGNCTARFPLARCICLPVSSWDLEVPCRSRQQQSAGKNLPRITLAGGHPCLHICKGPLHHLPADLTQLQVIREATTAGADTPLLSAVSHPPMLPGTVPRLGLCLALTSRWRDSNLTRERSPARG